MPWTADRVEAPRLTLLSSEVLGQLNSGKHDVVKSLSVREDTLARFTLECLWAVVEGKLQAEQLPLAVKATAVEGAVSAILAHVFWIVWSDIEGPSRDGFCEELNVPEAPLESEEAGRVVDALAECRRQNAITEQDILEILDLSLLVQSGNSAPQATGSSFSRKITIARNSKFLKIPTFNVFREELEGYAKLITLLNNPAMSERQHIMRVCSEIDQLAGYYQLSPGKVASCIIVAMEKDLANAAVRHSQIRRHGRMLHTNEYVIKQIGPHAALHTVCAYHNDLTLA